MKSGGASWTARTSVVDCAVSATIALMPWQPRRGERLQVGLDAGAAAGVRARDRETAWEPRALRLASAFVATSCAWDELLQGEELAYRTEVPGAARRDVVPIPERAASSSPRLARRR